MRVKNVFDYKQYIKENTIAIAIQVLGFLGLIFNIYLTSKLAPLAGDINAVKDRVYASEHSIDKLEDSSKLLYKFEADIKTIKDDVQLIKSYFYNH